MAQVDILKFQDEFPDAENRYSFAGTTYGYAVLGNATYKILLIVGSGAPSSNYDNAPNGSLYIDAANSGKVYKKDTSTWTAFT